MKFGTEIKNKYKSVTFAQRTLSDASLKLMRLSFVLVVSVIKTIVNKLLFMILA